jgi:DNA topoisomerase VI subunit B
MTQEQKDRKAIVSAFKSAVNMSAKELESWLETEESQEVGQKHEGDSESIGHRSGRHIIELLHKKPSDYTEDDLGQMQRVISYVHRHSAQRPDSEIEHTRWRYSLKNWGHDPLKDQPKSQDSKASSHGK